MLLGDQWTEPAVRHTPQRSIVEYSTGLMNLRPAGGNLILRGQWVTVVESSRKDAVAELSDGIASYRTRTFL